MIKKTLILILILMISSFVKGQNISLMTYNIRYGLADDGKQSRTDRVG